MSAMLQLVNQQPERSPLQEVRPGKFDTLIQLGESLEQKLACALAWIMQLRSENERLRTELMQARRELMIRETLLRNAAVRERELRVHFARGGQRLSSGGTGL